MENKSTNHTINTEKALQDNAEQNVAPTTASDISEQRLKMLKSTKRIGIISIVLGTISTLVWLPLGPWCGGYCGLLLIPYLIPSVLIVAICITILVICIIRKKQYKFQNKSLVILPIIGLVLSASLWIFLEVLNLISLYKSLF